MHFKLFMALVSLFILTFWQNPVFANPASGVFMVVKGDVKLFSKGKTIAAKIGQKIFEGDSITTGPDSRAKVVMSDKNVLNISPDTKIEITIYKNDPTTNTKKVDLKVDQGKVRAAVEQKYDDEKNTFRIKTPTAVAGVRGTDFSVSFNPTTRRSQVVTFKGLVAVVKPNANGSMAQPVLVRPGESSEISADSSKPESPKTMPKEELDKSDKDSVADVKDARSNNSPSNTETKKANAKKESPSQPDDKSTLKDQPNKPENKEAAVNTPANEPKGKESSANSPNSNPAPQAAAESKVSETRAPAQSKAPASASSIPNLVKADDLTADSAKRMAPPPPILPNMPRVPASAGPNAAVQNVINETVRNQVTGGGSGRTKLKIEIKRPQ